MRILLAEDDQTLNKNMTDFLIDQGYLVDSCLDGEEALFLAEDNIHDVILLDRMLPGMEGTDILKNLRKQNISIPVIMVTALGTLQDKLSGLNLGADDYLVKPFAFEELLARIQCVTRRSPVLSMQQPNVLNFADAKMDLQNLVLNGPTASCSLSKRESNLLEEFFRNPGQTLSRDTLLLKVWGPDSDVETGNLDNYIHFLRRRLKTVGSKLLLKTVRGIGYQIIEA